MKFQKGDLIVYVGTSSINVDLILGSTQTRYYKSLQIFNGDIRIKSPSNYSNYSFDEVYRKNEKIYSTKEEIKNSLKKCQK